MSKKVCDQRRVSVIITTQPPSQIQEQTMGGFLATSSLYVLRGVPYNSMGYRALRAANSELKCALV